jgi:hypothetical protein
VLSSGSLSFFSLFQWGDHRAYYIGLNPDILFSDPAYKIAPEKQQSLYLSDPRLVDKYFMTLTNKLDYCKVSQTLESFRMQPLFLPGFLTALPNTTS